MLLIMYILSISNLNDLYSVHYKMFSQLLMQPFLNAFLTSKSKYFINDTAGLLDLETDLRWRNVEK